MIRKDELETSVTICTRDRRRFLAVESIWCGSRLRAEALLVDQSSTPHPWPSSLSGEAGPQEVAGGFSPSLIFNGSLAFSYRYTTTHDVLGCSRSALHDWGGFDEPLGPGTRFSVAEDDDLVLWSLKTGYYQIADVPKATLYHRARPRSGGTLELREGPRRVLCQLTELRAKSLCNA